MKELKYALIIPSYNRPEKLDRLLRSLVDSGATRTKAYIYVDGGSLECLSKYSDIYYKYFKDYSDFIQMMRISKSNKGVSYARKVLMDFASIQSDYMIWVDDDEWMIQGFESHLDLVIEPDYPIQYFNLHGLIDESGVSSLSDIINAGSENTMIFKSKCWNPSTKLFVDDEILVPEWYWYEKIGGCGPYYAHKGKIVDYTPDPDDPNSLTGHTKDESWWRDVNHVGYTLHYNTLHRLMVEGKLVLSADKEKQLLRWHLKQTIYNMQRLIGDKDTADNIKRVLEIPSIAKIIGG